MFKEITKDNWLLYAQQNYDNPTLEKDKEFYDVCSENAIERFANHYTEESWKQNWEKTNE